jgi:hypothetical protein
MKLFCAFWDMTASWLKPKPEQVQPWKTAQGSNSETETRRPSILFCGPLPINVEEGFESRLFCRSLWINGLHSAYKMSDWSCIPAVCTSKFDHKNTGIEPGRRKKWHPIEMHTPLVGLDPTFPHYTFETLSLRDLPLVCRGLGVICTVWVRWGENYEPGFVRGVV